MREIDVKLITDTIEKLCIEANCRLPGDIREALENFRREEDWPIACGILDNITENCRIADEENVPVCQDCGMACVDRKSVV